MSQLLLLVGEEGARGQGGEGDWSESIRVSPETAFFPPYFEEFRDRSSRDDTSV